MQEEGKTLGSRAVVVGMDGRGALGKGFAQTTGERHPWSLCPAECIWGNSSEKDLIPLFPSFLWKLKLPFFQKGFFLFLPPPAPPLLILMFKTKPGAHPLMLMVQFPVC